MRRVFLAAFILLGLAPCATASVITLDSATSWHYEPKCCGYIVPFRVIVGDFEIEGRDVEHPFAAGIGRLTSASAFTMSIFRLDGSSFRPIAATVDWTFRGAGDPTTPFFNGFAPLQSTSNVGPGISATMDFPDSLWVLSLSLSIPPVGLEEVVTLRSLTLETIPEPAAAALLVTGIAGVLLRRRRR
jgi:hypothetical protein